MKLNEPGLLELVFTPTNGGAVVRRPIFNFEGKGGCGLGMYNTHSSITNFAHQSFQFAINRKMPMMLGTKNTILK